VSARSGIILLETPKGEGGERIQRAPQELSRTQEGDVSFKTRNRCADLSRNRCVRERGEGLVLRGPKNPQPEG